MATIPRPIPSDIAFTPTVKAFQQRKGSRHAYARMEQSRGWPNAITPELQGFIAEIRSFYLATANADGQPYIQHRGGPVGFLHVLDAQTLAFADFSGNKQFITSGNLADNPKAFIFLMDYAHRQRIKIWGEARIVDDQPELLQRLMPTDYPAKAEQVVVFKVLAWDANCPQHIPVRFEAAQVKAALDERDARIRALEQEVARLKAPAHD
ncbi:pyridoxamine 5'-phosphate oxidase family protein [uncultured Rhodoferax sp.]|uniref:pyridoxamine 5'-phosphate oxidase family protein n=1 Tax=uncultured Rhodoferax sp. TaxID=223188 RepID=UPI0025E8D0EE|nr:pyridoxamine 5'-phosphate oxidase family protein [uncultured Rhodoferax sp.]